MERVEIYDTTLRDGTQGEGFSLTVRDKLRIASRLDAFGVAYIEGGWPGSNPKDAEFFARAAEQPWKHAALSAFGSTRRASQAPGEDRSLVALVESGAPVCCIFGKTWNLHVTEVLRVSLDENLAMIEETLRFLSQAGRRVFYDAEHFFDGYRADRGYALETLRAARRGGAEVLVLCETNGGFLPWEAEAVVRDVREQLPDARLGIHAHDDSGCAVATSLAAVRAGATQVQGTIIGVGERCGNANLSVIIPNLELKEGRRCVPDGKLAELSDLSHFVAEIANVRLPGQMAYVGRSAFAHKGGVHVAAMRRSQQSYQHVDPALVGNESRVIVSDLSGRGNVLSKAEELGLTVDAGVELRVLEAIKDKESRGFSFEAAEASVALLLIRGGERYLAPFELLDYQVLVGKRRGTETFAEAIVKVRVGDAEHHTVAEGNGPVAALDSALRKALAPEFPALRHFHLADFKVRILDSGAGTEAITRVLIDTQTASGDGWSTVGASANIIEASLAALLDSIEYGLSRPAAELTTPSQRP